MIKRVTEYPGYLIQFSADAPTENAILMFHGFPATRGVKNLDIADYLHHHYKQDVYLLHYRGLGESLGVFKFTDSLNEASRVIEMLTENGRHKKIRLVGHSWGGLVSLNAADRHSALIESIVLISPFCDVQKSDPLYDWFVNDVRTELRHIFGNMTEAEIEKDFDVILENHLPKFIAPRLSASLPIGIVQASRDDVTPTATLKTVLPLFKTHPKYIELDQDHSFTQNRKELAETVIRLMK